MTDSNGYTNDHSRESAPATRRSWRASSGIAAAVACAAAAFLFAHPLRAATPDSGAPIVKTRAGEIRGIVDGGVREFLGVPYAAPPVGNLRWQPPAAHASWTGALDASRPGNACTQMSFRHGGIEGSEDCLYLNIYTPSPARERLPVMVWIHGGTFIVGSGATYDASKLAAKGNLIVVTINYRLGAFGFLASRSLDSAGHPSGNYGLLDQQAALRWVKDNIAAFGGDQHNVTVAGESAGAISIGLHLVSPAAAGLFARAILESGPFLHTRTLAEEEIQGDKFAAKLGCDKASDVAGCMRSKSTEEVLEAIPASPLDAGKPGWHPVMDGHLIPSQPAEALAAGRFNQVPVLNGSNRNEGTLFLAFGKPITAQQFDAGVHARFGGDATRVLAAYPLANYPSPVLAVAASFGDGIFSCPILKAGELLSARVPVYQYEFNDPNAPVTFFRNAPFPLGAYHSAEIQYVLGSIADNRSASPAQQKLSDAMMSYWIGFITSGNPGGSPAWTRLGASDPKVLSLAPGATEYESDFAKIHHCDLWNSIPR
ncbi:MAG: carboxylesterase/lipase family protein [Candidatus Binataceae bacterium]